EWPLPVVMATEIANWSGNAGLAGVRPGIAAGPGTLALDTFPHLLTFVNPRALEYFLRDKPLGPAAAPILAVRAARPAIAVSPEYPECYFSLADAYALLWGEQEEHWIGSSSATQELQPREKLRQIQLLTALEYFVMLRPQDEDAHWKLYQNYARLQYLDLA